MSINSTWAISSFDERPSLRSVTDIDYSLYRLPLSVRLAKVCASRASYACIQITVENGDYRYLSQSATIAGSEMNGAFTAEERSDLSAYCRTL
jgi:hypothetical protein